MARGGEYPGVVLESGLWAEIRPDRFRPGAFELIVDGTPQSAVQPEDPTELIFEYVQRMGVVLDQLPAGPLTAVHLGAGALTLPRYIEATHPGSRQQVLELEPRLVELVRAELPLPRGASIRVRYGDARATLATLPAALRGAADAVVVDIFGGGRIPPHVTSVEFYRAASALLAPRGILLVNIADGADLAFARGQAATVADVLPHSAALADTQMLKGRRFGNVVLLGSPAELPLEWLPRILAGGPHPSKVVQGRELTDWIAGARVVSDDSATGSPSPMRTIFQMYERGHAPGTE
ncbi:MAG: fused MFS/spermidine synthase [Micrococcales bacterium]|nr:fused MFS/spermidine synthase [Micrococcales bacterium]